MKVFDFTNGTKGELLATVNKANSTGSWLARKGDRVYRIELAQAQKGWSWHDGATLPIYNAKGKFDGDEAITPAQFGVEAICFCTGQSQHDQVWNWVVLGTCDWNRAAVKSGLLTSTFSHVSTEADRAEGIVFHVLHLREELRDAEVAARCVSAEVDPALVQTLLDDPAACKRIMEN